MKVYKIRPEPGFNPCIEIDIVNLATWFEEAEIGSIFTVEILEMSQGEIDALPEYLGP